MKKMETANNINEVIEFILEESMFSLEDYPVKFEKIKDGDHKHILFIGDNATGKSFVTSLIYSYIVEQSNLKWKGFNIGMRLRTSGGLHRIFLNDDQCNSTGQGSISNTLKALDQMTEKYGEFKDDKVLILDEPTIGLSSRFEKALGLEISNKLKEIKNNDKQKGVIIISHSKKMISSMINDGIDFTVYEVGNKYHTLEDWLKEEDDASLEELLGLKKKAINLSNEIANYRKNMNKEKE